MLIILELNEQIIKYLVYVTDIQCRANKCITCLKLNLCFFYSILLVHIKIKKQVIKFMNAYQT